MRTFIGMTSRIRHRYGHRPAAALSGRLRACDPRRQDGFLLSEDEAARFLDALETPAADSVARLRELRDRA